MLKNKWSSVVLWSVISAAFIGPGTVTTAVKAGSAFGVDLLWAVAFATVACIVLQEVAARIAIATGMNLGQALIRKFGQQQGAFHQYLLGGSVILGCAAFEAGNIMGAVSGLALLTGYGPMALTFAVTLVAGAMLWHNKMKWISHVMMGLVALMGIAFALLAFGQPFSVGDILRGSIVPTFPTGSGLVILGLIGTTIVPYNIFMGSGISKGQTIPLMRIGLVISVLVGGLITAAILVAGTAVGSFDNFGQVAEAFRRGIGPLGVLALSTGLFAAGFSSAVTSPFAAGIVVSTVFGWTNIQTIRGVMGAVLLTGFAFGISGIKPVPVILVVQVLNGFILPLLVAFLVLIVGDQRIMPAVHRPGKVYVLVLLAILGLVIYMGLGSIAQIAAPFLGIGTKNLSLGAMVITFVLTSWIGAKVFLERG